MATAGTLNVPEGTSPYPEGFVPAPRVGTSFIDAFISGVNGLRDALTKLRMDLTNAVADYASHPVRAVLAVTGIVTAMIALNLIYTAVKANVAALAVIKFLEGVWNAIKTVGAFFQVDTIITLIRLGDLWVSSFHKELAKVYEALGSLSEELSKDMSFIMVFTETGRAIMHSAYAISGNSWIKGEAEFADAMNKWLAGLKDKFNQYMESPQQIFIDIQKSIAEAAKEESDKQKAELVAAIDLVAGKVQSTGDELISLLAEIDRIKKSAPDEIQKAMDVWYIPFRTDYEKFLKENYTPFWETTNKALDIVGDEIRAHGISIEELQDKVRTPADFFRLLFGLPEPYGSIELDRTREVLFDIMDPDVTNIYDITRGQREMLAQRAQRETAPVQIVSLGDSTYDSIEIRPYVHMDSNGSWYRGDY